MIMVGTEVDFPTEVQTPQGVMQRQIGLAVTNTADYPLRMGKGQFRDHLCIFCVSIAGWNPCTLTRSAQFRIEIECQYGKTTRLKRPGHILAESPQASDHNIG